MMKISVTIIFLVGLNIPQLQAQNKIPFEEAKQQLILAIDSLEKHMPLDEYNGGWIARLEKEFYLDTAYIERLWSLEIDYNGSTMGMTEATRNAETAYDKLLNKYYKKLLDQLQGTDKEKLKVSQRNWLKFRDSEKELNYLLFDQQYSGGGTIHKIFVANKNTDITKQRVIELYHYLDRIWEPKKK